MAISAVQINDPTSAFFHHFICMFKLWPNENKMSDGGREGASLAVEVWKSSQCERGAIRRSLHRMVRPRVHFKACNRARLSPEDEKRTLAANEGKRLFEITRRPGVVNHDAIADKLPEVGGLCGDPLLFMAYDPPQGDTSDPHESGTEYQPLLHRGIVDEIEGESGNPLSRPELRRSMSAGRKDD